MNLDLTRAGLALAEVLGLEEVATGLPHRGTEFRIGDGYQTVGPAQLAELVMKTVVDELFGSSKYED